MDIVVVSFVCYHVYVKKINMIKKKIHLKNIKNSKIMLSSILAGLSFFFFKLRREYILVFGYTRPTLSFLCLV